METPTSPPQPTPTPTSTTRTDDNAVSWIKRLLCIPALGLLLWVSYSIYTPDTAATSFRILFSIIYLLAVLAPLFTKNDPPSEFLATCCHWLGTYDLISLLYTTVTPNGVLKLLLLPSYIIIAFLLTAPIMTSLLILVEGKFDSERLGTFGDLVLWIKAQLLFVYHKVVSAFILSLHKNRYERGFGFFHRVRHNPPTDTEKCPNQIKQTRREEKDKTELETQN
ncbi:hypothetical protein E1B28_005246 [Marasmius oreades]|uniref:Transmembrane protein n=1 Tax=Marasmius oreades TaxID=181124 RepID=A0A9P8AE34_9AGAR|nr:uncharacterized protein E1B28_005246 [Marasmius oreades]KAG7097935.1 hypothetical protein E1B28_005246 [Marasmius oreades]